MQINGDRLHLKKQVSIFFSKILKDEYLLTKDDYLTFASALFILFASIYLASFSSVSE